MIEVFGINFSGRTGRLIENFISSAYCGRYVGHRVREKPLSEEHFRGLSLEQLKSYKNLGDRAIEEIVKKFREANRPMERLEADIEKQQRIKARRINRLANRKKCHACGQTVKEH